jgi:ATP-binding cassette subfamily B protein
LPVGVTQDEAVAALRAQGQDRVADMLSAMTPAPREGVDFHARD